MIKVKLLDILDKKDRNLNWLATNAGITYSTLYNFAHQNTNSVTYDVLDKLCSTLRCNIHDILSYIPVGADMLPASELEMLENAISVIGDKKNNEEEVSSSETDFLHQLMLSAINSQSKLDEDELRRLQSAYIACSKLLPIELSVSLLQKLAERLSSGK